MNPVFSEFPAGRLTAASAQEHGDTGDRHCDGAMSNSACAKSPFHGLGCRRVAGFGLSSFVSLELGRENVASRNLVGSFLAVLSTHGTVDSWKPTMQLFETSSSDGTLTRTPENARQSQSGRSGHS